MIFLGHRGLNMIRNIPIFILALMIFTSCATSNNFQTTQSFAPAKFEINDVFVNMTDGIENSNRIKSLMRRASRNTAKIYNNSLGSTQTAYPLEIDVKAVNYRNPNTSASAENRTFIRYVAILREEASGEVFRELPVTYFHVTTSALNTDVAKQNAEKNMIRVSLKNAFARLYGMQTVPHSVQTHFSSHDIFSDGSVVKLKPVVPAQPVVTPAPKLVVAQTPAISTPSPQVVIAPDQPIIETTTVDGEPTVIKCIVC